MRLEVDQRWRRSTIFLPDTSEIRSRSIPGSQCSTVRRPRFTHPAGPACPVPPAQWTHRPPPESPRSSPRVPFSPSMAEDLWRLIPKPQPGAGPLAETDPRSAERHRHLGPAHIVDPGERQFQDGPVQGRLARHSGEAKEAPAQIEIVTQYRNYQPGPP